VCVCVCVWGGGVATTSDVGAAGWGALLSPAAAHRDRLTHMFK